MQMRVQNCMMTRDLDASREQDLKSTCIMSDLNRVRVWPICCQCTLSALRASGQSIFGTARLYDCTTVAQLQLSQLYSCSTVVLYL